MGGWCMQKKDDGLSNGAEENLNKQQVDVVSDCSNWGV